MAVTTETGLRNTVRQWYPLALIYLSVGFSTAFAAPFLTLFLTTAVRADPVHVTIYLVAAPLSAVVVSTLLGRLSDRRAIRRRLLIVAALAGCVTSGLFAFVRDYWILLLLVVTAMAVTGALIPQVFAYARSAVRGASSATVVVSSLRTLFSVAWVAGPPLAAVVLSVGGFTAIYLFASAMYAIAALIALRWLPDQQPVVVDATDPAPAVGRNAPRRVVVLAMAAFMALQCASSLSVQLVSLFVRHDLGGTVRDSGLILGLCAGLEIPLMLGLGVLSARVPLRRLILAGPLFSMAYFAVAAATTHTWQLAAAQILNACAIAVIQGLGVAYFLELLPRSPGRASTLYSNNFPAGAMLAGPILGASGHLGYRFGYIAAAVLGAVGLVLLLINRPLVRSQAGPVMRGRSGEPTIRGARRSRPRVEAAS